MNTTPICLRLWRIAFSTALLVLYIIPGQAQTTSAHKDSTLRRVNAVKQLLQPGKHTVDRMGVKGLTVTKRSDLQVIGHDTLEIIYDSTAIRFKAGNAMKALNNLHIDITNNKAFFQGQALSYKGKKEDKAEEGYGYMYEFEESDTSLVSGNASQLNMTTYRVSVGQMNGSPETWLVFMALKYAKGTPVLNIIYLSKFK